MKNINLIFILLLLVVSCALKVTTSEQGASPKPFIIGTYASPPYAPDKTTILYDSLISQLKDLHCNAYTWLIMPDKKSFEQLKEFLPIAKKNNIEVWAMLIPPTELAGKPDQYPTNDMHKWAADLATLSLTNSNFKAWSIDDFVHNIKLYTPQYVKEFQTVAKKINPDFKFYPVCYYVSIGKNFAVGYGSIIDGIWFPYRNESVKADLVDDSHVADEISTLRGYLGKLPIFLSVYSSGHGEYGNPTTEYISNVIQSAIQNADGLMVYRHPSPKWDAEKYKTVKAAIAKGLAEKK